MSIRVRAELLSSRELAPPLSPSFEAIRRFEVPVPLPEAGAAADPLARARLTCQKGIAPHAVTDCLECRHLVGWRQVGPGAPVHLACQWSERDPVLSLMSWEPALVLVASHAGIDEADELARTAEVRHLIVVDENELRGVVCRCDLVRVPAAGETVGDRAQAPVVIDAQAPLGAALATMNGRGIGCLPVVMGERLVGVITRGDLRRAGVPDDLLGGGRCAACGSPHGVTGCDSCGAVEFCLECLERVAAPGDGDQGDGAD